MAYRVRSDREVIGYLQDRARVKNPLYLYAGAGVSVEADIDSANRICDDILKHFTGLARLRQPPPADPVEAAKMQLEWADEGERYIRCIEARYETRAERVDFFRTILTAKRPAFGHHAIAMLMKRGYFQGRCLTTNFDKLLEIAFIDQRSECQPIRAEAELPYLVNVPDRYFVLKLHGDYDTHNVANTAKETAIILEPTRKAVAQMVERGGMFVLGAAGNETSVAGMFNDLTGNGPGVLEHGLFWGVYMGQRRPAGLSDRDVEAQLRFKVDKEKVVSPAIRRVIEKSANFCFFPVWGSGQFFYDLINDIADRDLLEESEPYLDRAMRLRKTFSKLTEAAVDKHLELLAKQQKAVKEKNILPFDPADHCICVAAGKGFPVRVKLIYADMMAMPLMHDAEYSAVRRAVISSEDTCISAGGGVAYSLVERAGAYNLLHELAKFSSIPQRSIAVTSAGNLPVHYIFHAAALEISKDARYSVTKEDVRETMANALRMAKALSVKALWTPILATGLAPLKLEVSLSAILEGVALPEFQKVGDLSVIVMIYKEKMIERADVLKIARKSLGAKFSVSVSAAAV